MEDVWRWVLELDAVRSFNDAGPEPTRFAELEAWARITGRTLTVDEVHAVMRVDRAMCWPGKPEDEQEDDG